MILLYHTVHPDYGISDRWSVGPILTLAVFKRHILWLVAHYHLVSLGEYLDGLQQLGYDGKKRIAITFDDGFKGTFECVHSFLEEQEIPATFFVSTGHVEHGELLWFSYLNALCFERLFPFVEIEQRTFPLGTLEQCRRSWYALAALAKASGDPVVFCRRLAKTYPIPPEVAALYAGMTSEQLREAGRGDLLEIGGHTVTHPYLDQLPREAQAQEILDGRRVLSELLGKPVRYFAYPGGEYNAETLELVRAAGFEAAFAVTPRDLETSSQFEIERVGIYSHSLLKLRLKIMGLPRLARRFGLRLG